MTRHSLDKDHWIHCLVCDRLVGESCYECGTCLEHCSEVYEPIRRDEEKQLIASEVSHEQTDVG
jgi:hypothetical protein